MAGVAEGLIGSVEVEDGFGFAPGIAPGAVPGPGAPAPEASCPGLAAPGAGAGPPAFWIAPNACGGAVAAPVAVPPKDAVVAPLGAVPSCAAGSACCRLVPPIGVGIGL